MLPRHGMKPTLSGVEIWALGATKVSTYCSGWNFGNALLCEEAHVLLLHHVDVAIYCTNIECLVCSVVNRCQLGHIEQYGRADHTGLAGMYHDDRLGKIVNQGSVIAGVRSCV